MAEPRKANGGRVERITYNILPGAQERVGETESALVRRNRTQQETKDQYMRLMGTLQRQWRNGESARLVTERQRRLTRAYTRTMNALGATNRGWDAWTIPTRLVNRK